MCFYEQTFNGRLNGVGRSSAQPALGRLSTIAVLMGKPMQIQRIQCTATATNDCQYSLRIEYACRKGWYIGPNQYCLPCKAGTYSNTEEAASCKNCQFNQYSVSGATSCDFTNTTCPAGTYSQEVNACVSCVAGKYQTQTGALSEATCLSCSPGKYSEKTRAALASDCINCVQGKWSSTTAANNQSTCEI